jgi:transposase
VDLDPIAQESGAGRESTALREDAPNARWPLYMVALSCTQDNERPREFYHRLSDNGKEKKVALSAVARELLVIANTTLKNQPHW